MTMLIAGHETSAAVLTWTLFELSRRPEVRALPGFVGHGHIFMYVQDRRAAMWVDASFMTTTMP